MRSFLFFCFACFCAHPQPSAFRLPATQQQLLPWPLQAGATCGLGLWSPATRCEGCSAQARLNHAVAHRIWPAATWRAAADGTGTPPLRRCACGMHPMRRRRRRRQVRRCPFNRCRRSSRLCDVRCHLSRNVCHQQTLGSTWRSYWMAQASSAHPWLMHGAAVRCMRITWPALVIKPSRAHRPDIAAAVWSAAEADADPGATTEDCAHVCTCLGAQPTACLTLRPAVSAAGADGYSG